MNHRSNRRRRNGSSPVPQLALLAAVTGIAGLCMAAAPMRPAPSNTAPSNPALANAGRAPAMVALATDDNDGRDGAYKSDEEHARDIRWLLADVSDRAANDDGWQRVSDWLSSNDRHRIEDGLKDAKTGEYAAAARAFRQAWKDKYHENFNAHKNMDDITGVKIEFHSTGGRKLATATFPSFGGMQPYEMHLQLEAKDKWRVEIPNDVDAQKFVDNLEKGLKNIVDNKASLFKDETLGLNSAITQMLHGLSFEPGTEHASAERRRSNNNTR